MDIQGFRCHVVSSCVAAAMLAGCGGGKRHTAEPLACRAHGNANGWERQVQNPVQLFGEGQKRR